MDKHTRTHYGRIAVIAVLMILSLAAQACNLPRQAATTPEPNNVPTAEILEITSTPTAAPLPPTPEPEVSAKPSLIFIKMLNRQEGWGLTEQQVLRTPDGGHTWWNVTPTGGAGFANGNGFFLDASHAWVIAPSQDYQSSTLYRTENGGLSWDSYPQPFGPGQLQFLDLNTGFILVVPSAGAGSAEADIYTTSDGGKTWNAAYNMDPTQADQPGGLPLSGQKSGITFLTPERGWVAGSVPMDNASWLFMSQDGGKVWAQQLLELPGGYTQAMLAIDPPRFFSAGQGILPVYIYTQETARSFYQTTDSGSTWTPTPPLALTGPYDFINPQYGWVWNGQTLAVTQDGGMSYTTYTTNVDLSQTLMQIDFVDPGTGWATSMDSSGAGTLYQTTDGGLNWTPLW